jgi:hypothetical protein
LISGRFGLVILLQSEPHIPWVAVIALLAHWLQVDLVELCLHCHLLVARRTSKVVDTPGLIEGSENVGLDNLVAHLAEVPKQLVVVSLTVGEAFPLVVPITEEWLFALCADKVFNMPMFSQSGYNSLFYWTTTCSANWYTHFVMTPKTIKFI